MTSSHDQLKRPKDVDFVLEFCGDPEESVARQYIEALEARAALAQPEPEGLTDEELDKVLFQAVNAYMETRGPFDGPVDHLRLDRAKARAAIAADRARWGRPLPTQPTTTP